MKPGITDIESVRAYLLKRLDEGVGADEWRGEQKLGGNVRASAIVDDG